MRTKDLTAAMKELEVNGFKFRMDTAAYTEDGRVKNIYLEGEFGGFAIHIMQKQVNLQLLLFGSKKTKVA